MGRKEKKTQPTADTVPEDPSPLPAPSPDELPPLAPSASTRSLSATQTKRLSRKSSSLRGGSVFSPQDEEGGAKVSSRRSSTLSNRGETPRSQKCSPTPTSTRNNADVTAGEGVDPLAATSSGLGASCNPTIPSAEARANAIQTAVNDINLDDICFKIVLIGDSGVGKSAVTFRFCDDVFFEEGAPTLGVDFKYARIETAEAAPRTARLQIWDTAGQEAFLTLTTGFYRSAAGVVLCFDITNRMSFLHLDLWMQRIKDNCRGGTNESGIPPVILVGCKLDLARYDPFTITAEGKEGGGSKASKKSAFNKDMSLPQNAASTAAGGGFCHRQVSQAEADAWCEANGVLCYFETSAKENSFVMDAFRHITTYIVQHTKMHTVAKGTANGKGGKGTGSGVFFKPKAAADKEKPEKPHKGACAKC